MVSATTGDLISPLNQQEPTQMQFNIDSKVKNLLLQRNEPIELDHSDVFMILQELLKALKKAETGITCLENKIANQETEIRNLKRKD